MTEQEWKKLLKSIPAASDYARQQAAERWASCAKPLGSLGLLEKIVEDLAALTGSGDIDLSKRRLLVLCSDNGVVRQGVAQSDPSVTRLVAGQIAQGRTGTCRMAAVARCQVLPVDLGMLEPAEGVADRHIARGTGDITKEPAMTRQQALDAIAVGIALVEECRREGIRLIATGEMGIGNTTTSGAICSVLLGLEPEQVVGRGAGLSDAGLERKRAAVRTAIDLHQPDREDILDVLSKLGGFDLAGLCGVFLGGGLYQIPVIIDGLISSTAALCAQRLCPECSGAMIASHLTGEPAGAMVLQALGKKPLITAQLRLGEGSGAVAAIPLLDMALAVYQDSCTFAEAGLTPYEPLGGEQK